MAKSSYVTSARKIARRYGIPVQLFLNQVGAESGWQPGVVSSAGAIGLVQLMPGTARGLGVDPYNPVQNLEGGAKYLREQYDTFKGLAAKIGVDPWELALAAYNAGPGAVEKYGGVPPFAETQSYVKRIMSGLKTTAAGPERVSTTAAAQSPVSTASGPDLATVALTNLANHSTPLESLTALSDAVAAGAQPNRLVTHAVPVDTLPPSSGNYPVQFEGSSLQGTDPRFAHLVAAAAHAAGATQVRLVSAYRSPAHNAAVGGVSRSNHMYGHAFDGEALIGGKWVPLGDLPTLTKFHLRSGDQPGFYRGGRDPSHVDDAYNQHH